MAHSEKNPIFRDSGLMLVTCLLFGFIHAACGQAVLKQPDPYLIILGTIQDGGSPHIGCKRECCTGLFDQPDPDRMVVSIGLIDPRAQKRFLFEATPDMTRQLHRLNEAAPYGDMKTADGIFLTHAHIGHYTGLMYLGREAMNSNKLPVYVMPKMAEFLRTNGPWSQLISLENIELHPLISNEAHLLSDKLKVTPLLVPHRDEFSETVGFLIEGPGKKALFIPDIDKWHKWDRDLVRLIKEIDYAFIDGSFFNSEEVGYRDVSEIPHPFIPETMELLNGLEKEERARVYFIHFNHTNPVIDPESEERKSLTDAGYQVAEYGDRFKL